MKKDLQFFSIIDNKFICLTVELHPEDKVSIKNFKIHKLLGTGAYGKVFLVEKLDGVDKGHLYAMKVLEKNKVTQKKKTTEHTRTEREVYYDSLIYNDLSKQLKFILGSRKSYRLSIPGDSFLRLPNRRKALSRYGVRARRRALHSPLQIRALQRG
jgi:serine/threonine protein kinase